MVRHLVWIGLGQSIAFGGLQNRSPLLVILLGPSRLKGTAFANRESVVLLPGPFTFSRRERPRPAKWAADTASSTPSTSPSTTVLACCDSQIVFRPSQVCHAGVGPGLPMPRTASSILPCRRLARHRPEPPKVSRHLVVCRGVPGLATQRGVHHAKFVNPSICSLYSTTSTSLTTHRRATPTDQLSRSGRQRGTVATGPLTHGWAKPGQYLKIDPVT